MLNDNVKYYLENLVKTSLMLSFISFFLCACSIECDSVMLNQVCKWNLLHSHACLYFALNRVPITVKTTVFFFFTFQLNVTVNEWHSVGIGSWKCLILFISCLIECQRKFLPGG